MKKQTEQPTFRRILAIVASTMRRVLTSATRFGAAAWKKVFRRETAANLLMIAFIIMTSIGAWLIYPPIGFIVGGVGCGIFGYILGLE